MTVAVYSGEMPTFRPAGRPGKYPWDDIEVGQYFILDAHPKSGPAMARAASERYAPKVFKTKCEGSAVQCWRIK